MARREKDRLPVLLWLNVAGLDAPLVAVLWQALFAAVLRVSLALPEVAVLFCATWLVYLADRLLDAWPERRETSPRHDFTLRNRRTLTILAGLLTLGCLVLLAFLSWTIIVGGLVLTLVVWIHFTLVHAFGVQGRGLKEIMAGTGFAAGVLLVPCFKIQAEFEGALVLVGAVGFTVACCTNCLLLNSDGNRKWQPRVVAGACLGWAMTLGLASLFYPASGPRLVLAVGTSLILLGVLAVSRNWNRTELDPALADACLLTPLPVLLAYGPY